MERYTSFLNRFLILINLFYSTVFDCVSQNNKRIIYLPIFLQNAVITSSLSEKAEGKKAHSNYELNAPETN